MSVEASVRWSGPVRRFRAITTIWLLLLPAAVVQAGYVDEVLRDTPVAYWRLGEGDVGDPIVDAAGKVPDGQYIDNLNIGPELGFEGAIVNDPNTAIQITTTPGFNCGDCGYGEIPVGGPLDLGTTSNATVTLEAWFKILPSVNDSLPPSYFNRLFHYNNGASGQYAFGIVGDNSGGFPGQRTVFGAVGTGADSGGVILAGPADAIEPSDDEQWYYLVALLEKDDVRLFLNAEELVDLGDSDPIAWQATQATIGARVQDNGSLVHPFPGLIDEMAIYNKLLTEDRIQAHYLVGTQGTAGTPLQAGDADQDLDFDQLDLVRVQVAAKYLTGQQATWGEGDWDAAPGGEVGAPPTGDGQFSQLDIIAALSNGLYLTGPYGAIPPTGQPGDGQTSIVYHADTGEVEVDAPAGTNLTSVNIDSASGIFSTHQNAQNLGGSFDTHSEDNLFKATFGSSFGSLGFGAVAQLGLAADFVANDLTVVGSLEGGGGLGAVDLIYVPEPSVICLLTLGLLGVLLARRR